jgi:hypothetical protein
MSKGRFVFAAILALAAANARAAAPTIVIDDSDFTLQDRSRAPVDWQANGTAGLQLDLTSTVPISLALTHNLAREAGTAWTLVEGSVPSFTMWADVNIRFQPGAPGGEPSVRNCPADGFAMAFANTTPDAVGGAGSDLALFQASKTIHSFTAFEVNLFFAQAPGNTSNLATCDSGKNVTFAFDNVNQATGYRRDFGRSGTPDKGGAKVAQVTAPTGLQIVNGGWYRYQWNVDAVAGTMAAYITVLQDSNKAIRNVPLTNVTFGSGAPQISFIGRWGVAASTGGAASAANVARVRIVSPMVPAGSPTAAE